MAIFLADFDNQLVDWLVEYELTDPARRTLRVMNELINAFQAIAPEEELSYNHAFCKELRTNLGVG